MPKIIEFWDGRVSCPCWFEKYWPFDFSARGSFFLHTPVWFSAVELRRYHRHFDLTKTLWCVLTVVQPDYTAQLHYIVDVDWRLQNQIVKSTATAHKRQSASSSQTKSGERCLWLNWFFEVLRRIKVFELLTIDWVSCSKSTCQVSNCWWFSREKTD